MAEGFRCGEDGETIPCSCCALGLKWGLDRVKDMCCDFSFGDWMWRWRSCVMDLNPRKRMRSKQPSTAVDVSMLFPEICERR